MFSDAQQRYIDALLPTYAKEGYKYYVIYTNSVASGGFYTSTEPDLYAVFSKTPISAQDAYTYGVGESSILVTIRSYNYSSSSSANNSDRVVVTDFSSRSLEIPGFEHVYTNAEFTGHTLQPDYYLASGGETNVQIEAISFILLIVGFFVILYNLWLKRFRGRGRL